jgi:hypothetical protein
MKVRDERYWLGMPPWVFVPVFVAVACGSAVLIESPWLRVPVQVLVLPCGPRTWRAHRGPIGGIVADGTAAGEAGRR